MSDYVLKTDHFNIYKGFVYSFVAIVLVSFDLNAQYSAMTYNIRYATDRDGINSWENRKEWVSDLINYYEPDVLGIQEGLINQVSIWIRSLKAMNTLVLVEMMQVKKASFQLFSIKKKNY